MKKAVILFSGGLDSTTCLAYAQSEQFDCHAISFSYGQKHSVELNAAKKIAEHFRVAHKIFTIDIGQFGGSSLTSTEETIPDFDSSHQVIPNTYVPARNTIFLSIALAWAEVLSAKDIFVGVSSVDYSGYPDCRPEYMQSFEQLANLATKIGVEEQGIRIHAPLMYLSKAETIQLGTKLGVDYATTISCYRADQQGKACGTCDSCVYRKKGFAEAEIIDPTIYA